jgi:hypothetical protein
LPPLVSLLLLQPAAKETAPARASVAKSDAFMS